MVRDVSRNDVCQGSNAERIIAGNALPHPRLARHVSEERNGRPADLVEFIDMRRPGHLVRIGARRGYVLIVARQRSVEARPNQSARNAKARSVSVTWFKTWRMLHFSGA
jgi:hypothetical protein